MRTSTERGRRAGKGRGDAGAVVVGGQPARAPPMASRLAPSSATSTSCTPRCFFCRPFPPTSLAKHIKAFLSRVGSATGRRLPRRRCPGQRLASPSVVFVCAIVHLVCCWFWPLKTCLISSRALMTDDCCSAMAFCKDWQNLRFP